MSSPEVCGPVQDLTRIEQIGNRRDGRDSPRGRTPRAGKPRGTRKSREGSGSRAGAKELMTWEDHESKRQSRKVVVANRLKVYRTGAVDFIAGASACSRRARARRSRSPPLPKRRPSTPRNRR